ncbi:MAG: multiheme c-type cytochrome [Desulfomicrobium sp.]|nr:multiheme c-type cytochrome [Desulfomicrobium sp.]MDP3428773.1 multiheme c-type cytochrome [Desulfomicrobium sp.]
MERKNNFLIALAFMAGAAMLACGSEKPTDVKAVMAQPKAFVGSETCRSCHLEHYDSWKMTLHSRMLIDVREDPNAFVVEWNKDTIRTDLEKIKDKLKVPLEEVYIPEKSEVIYVIGTQWKQRYVLKKGDMFVVAPVQYNVASKRWVNYYEDAWDKRDWLVRCGGCHATGVDLKTYTFNEKSIGCEACHGAGSRHAALPRTALFEKRDTIVHPAKMTSGVAVQICGSCHTRGNSKDPDFKDAGWPVGFEPGMVLEPIYQNSYEKSDMRRLYPDFASRSHHQQYIDWVQSKHAEQGVTCTSCHSVHRIGIAPTRFQTKEAGSSQCLSCHSMVNANRAHSIHSFANCLGCHMPRIASTAEPNDIRSHTFEARAPMDTINNPDLPNSCQLCHYHKDETVVEMQRKYEILTQLPKPQGMMIPAVSQDTIKQSTAAESTAKPE